jgi:hypothetical protein
MTIAKIFKEKLLTPGGYSSSEEGRSRSRSPSKSPQQKNEEQILVDKISSLYHFLPPSEKYSLKKSKFLVFSVFRLKKLIIGS